MIELAELNAMTAPQFVAALGAIFEHSPWVAERAAAARPFDSRLHLLETLCRGVGQASTAEQMALIRAHPQLGVRGRGRAELTRASATEQRGAGLDACSPEEIAELDELNGAYVEKFAMPFILAVRGHEPESIIANMQRRLAHDALDERRTALAQIGSIAGFRLAELVVTPAGAEIIAMNQRLAAPGDTASGASDGARAQLRQWMLAAGMDVVAAAGTLIGRVFGDGRAGARLLLGAHYDISANALHDDGRLGYLLAIAVSQRLKARGKKLPFELLVLARPSDAPVGSCENLADRDVLRGCVALTEIDGDTRQSAATWQALHANHLAERSLVIAVRGPAGAFFRGEPPCTAAVCERAAHTLEDFLLSAAPTRRFDG